MRPVIISEISNLSIGGKEIRYVGMGGGVRPRTKLTDWIWKSTPYDVESAAGGFSGSAVAVYMFKTHGLGVNAVDGLAYCHHIALFALGKPCAD